MKIVTLIFIISVLILSYNCRAENIDPSASLSKPIHEIFKCRPFGKKTVFEISELKLKGTAANSTKGIYYEMHLISKGDVEEILIAAPASGKGGSAVTLKNDEIYSMDCSLLSQ